MKRILRIVLMSFFFFIQVFCAFFFSSSMGEKFKLLPSYPSGIFSYFIIGFVSCGFLISVVFYFFMDVRSYSRGLPILIFCISLRQFTDEGIYTSLTAIIPEAGFISSYAFFLGLCYIQQVASIYYIDQLFHFGMHKWTKRSILMYCLFLYLIYFITPQEVYNIYFRKMCPIAMFCVNFLMLIQFFEKLTVRHKNIFSAAVQYSLLQISLIIDMLCFGGYTGGAAHIISGSSLLLFGVLFLRTYAKEVSAMYTNNKKIVQMQADINDANIKLLLSQIRPHFLYNTLNAICALCYTEPKRAGEAIVQFSKYLRSNMKSIEKSEPAEFAEEMTHVESYIWIEKMRLGNRLNVIYNFEEKDFFIPLLTVEPLVENAIRHGISKRVEGGTLTIHTYKDIHNYYIDIIDNGIGFGSGEISQFSFETTESVGIKNVSKRLEMMMNGKLEIVSKKNFGTTATITLPIDYNSAKPFELLYRTKDGEWIKCVI